MTVILLLNEICAQSCSICSSNRSIIKYPDAEALTDGTTCEQLEYQAHNFDESDHICASFYQVIGFATCGCTDKADDSYRESAIIPRQSYCRLCTDGSIPDSDAIYDTDTLVTCGKVQDYLQGNIGQSDELCNVFQYRGVVNCGCSHSSISKPSCSLCKHEGQRVIDVHALAESDAVDTTCGVMEYILAVDVDNQYDANTCESLQNYFAPKCDCGQDFQMQNEDMVDAPAATASPSIIASSSPTNNPTHVSSNVPSSTSSLQPSYLPSEALSVQPSVMPSIKESSLPSSFPTRLPSIEPTITSSSKPTLEASSSPTNSTSPSLFPSVHPTASNLPSFSPSSLLDRTANCTALKLGIMPHVQDSVAEKLEIIINFYLWVEYEQELDISLDQLMEAFDRRISFIAAECTNMTPSRQLDALGSMKDIEEPVYFVQMNELSEVMDVGCSETAASVTVICLPISSKVTAFYSPLESQNGTLDSARTNVETFITRIIQQEFSSLAQSIPGIYNGTTVDEFGYHREQLSSGKKAAIGVGISCSVVALIAMGIVSRRGREMRTENMGIIPEGHIRSDDSISDNPTISSGRRAQMTGWEGSITDGSSSQYSRQMYSPRISDTSDGIISNRATSRQLRENSYLPGNVLRDLLGADDGDLSLGTREYDDDDMSFDHNDTIEL